MKDKIFQWAIVGAGPAGIAAVGKLLDLGVKPESILWLDPKFTVGDLGALWKNASSNTTVQLFIHFLQASPAFLYDKAPIDFKLNHLLPEKTCTLREVVEPLQWVTNHLCQKIHSEKTIVQRLSLANRVWSIYTSTQTHLAKHVILATGALPIDRVYPELPTIPLSIAMDKAELKTATNLNETYAVFGSSHSAIMIISYLVDLGVKKIINFYRSPCRYAINMGDWILFDNTGLKGQTAEWARQHIDGALPPNLVRYPSNKTNIAKFLPECAKAIYAIGFKARDTITIGDYEQNQYNPHVGIIGPGLFGLGIGFPELKTDPFGGQESQVGLWKFMVYLNKVLPLWVKYHT